MCSSGGVGWRYNTMETNLNNGIKILFRITNHRAEFLTEQFREKYMGVNLKCAVKSSTRCTLDIWRTVMIDKFETTLYVADEKMWNYGLRPLLPITSASDETIIGIVILYRIWKNIVFILFNVISTMFATIVSWLELSVTMKFLHL